MAYIAEKRRLGRIQFAHLLIRGTQLPIGCIQASGSLRRKISSRNALMPYLARHTVIIGALNLRGAAARLSRGVVREKTVWEEAWRRPISRRFHRLLHPRGH